MDRRRFLCALLPGLTAVFGASCISIERNAAGYRRRGVWLPKRKEDHGYRGSRALHLEGHTLLFDAHLGVYVVEGLPDHFYLAGRFYRCIYGGWEISPSLTGTWSPVAMRYLPPGLRRPCRP